MNIDSGLFEFIKKSPTPYHAVAEIKKRLLECGFSEICDIVLDRERFERLAALKRAICNNVTVNGYIFNRGVFKHLDRNSRALAKLNGLKALTLREDSYAYAAEG